MESLLGNSWIELLGRPQAGIEFACVGRLQEVATPALCSSRHAGAIPTGIYNYIYILHTHYIYIYIYIYLALPTFAHSRRARRTSCGGPWVLVGGVLRRDGVPSLPTCVPRVACRVGCSKTPRRIERVHRQGHRRHPRLRCPLPAALRHPSLTLFPEEIGCFRNIKNKSYISHRFVLQDYSFAFPESFPYVLPLRRSGACDAMHVVRAHE